MAGFDAPVPRRWVDSRVFEANLLTSASQTNDLGQVLEVVIGGQYHSVAASTDFASYISLPYVVGGARLSCRSQYQSGVNQFLENVSR